MQTDGKHALNLGGTWRVQSSCGTWDFSMPVPGSVFAELEKLGAFGAEGAFWRENNRLCQDTAERDFTLTRAFEIPDGFPLEGRRETLYLECDGLDTLAEIRLNGSVAGRADNMHRRWRFPAGELLRAGPNEIAITFSNAAAYCRAKAQARALWQTYEDYPELAAPHFNQIRKSHCSFGWDWGPIVPDVGIWRDIRLVAYGPARLDSVSVMQEHGSGGTVTLTVSGELGEGRSADPSLRLAGTLAHPDGAMQAFSFGPGDAFSIPVENPRLWWPAGLGEQPLYALSVGLFDSEGTELDRKDLRVGLRTLTVRREKDQWGESFEFVCNGVPFFSRGANYIPEDIYLSRVTPGRTRRLLEDCALANFNTVRVWGGGVYPPDTFYDACDELGLVVWQDLMFACALYDVGNPDFLANVSEEVRDNVRRLRHHPSLGLLCGNNEMEIALVAWNIPHGKEHREEYVEQYQVRFPEICAKEAPQTFYWPASPSSGGSFDDPNAPDRGDCHYWEVWHGFKDFHDFTRHYFRYMSEFGFESYPDLKTVESFSLPEDRVQGSPVMEDHQRCVLGTSKLSAYLARYFRAPKDFAALVYLSQVNQAEALRTGIEHWRRNRGRCMGSIYWQLNDNWPVNSWSSIDSAGRWKLLHYAVKRAYAPLVSSVEALSPTTPGGPAVSGSGGGHPPADSPRVALHLSNEAPRGFSGILSWRLLTPAGSELASGRADFSVPPFTSVAAAELDFTALLDRGVPDRRVSPRREALLFYAWETRGDGGTRPLSGRGCHAFAPWRSVELVPARVSLSVAETAEAPAGRAVVLRSDKPALFVTLSARDFDLLLEDNGIALDGRNERILRVLRGGEGLTNAQFAESLTVTHLRETY